MKHTHRINITKKELESACKVPFGLFKNYYKDGCLYGYYADGVLLGGLVEINDEYVNFEWWLQVDESKIEELEK